MRRALLLLVALALSSCGGDRPAASPAAGSTLTSTLVDPDGDGFLQPGPGEPLQEGGARAKLGRTLATFAQLTDTHVRDEESPARVPFLDRTGNPFTSTFRPQEAFSTQVLDAAVRALNREKPQAVFVTGDITDNAQRNELTQALATLNGGTVDPDSGDKGYDGVQAPDSADPFYYRPDHDAPTHPGALAAAQKPFKAAGLKAPWYPLVGNHDVLAQGEVPVTPEIDAFATGDRLVPSLDPDLKPPREETSAKAAVAALLGGSLAFDSIEVPADPARRLNAPGEAERRLGHPSMNYTQDLGRNVRAIMLDTVNRDGTSQARINPAQIAWLRAQLAEAGDRWIVVFSHNPLTDEALAALDESPRVVATIAGNSHKNRIEQHGRYWRISTSSLADFPQQARMFRLRETSTGGVALETWMVDHDGKGLAGISRELAYLDAQGGRPQHFAGARSDRNARLYVSP
jgi:3',5'-cyclic AMP phosphodiesterase CpdA